MNINTGAAAGITLALLSSTQALAATGADDIVVTATRQEARSNELLADVSVITREEIAAAAQSSLPELLARQPGIEFDANGGAGSSMSLYIRGTNSEHALILIDGMRINTASKGLASLSMIPLAQIERIEILRGPASSLYGADAIGGVVHIFTRRGGGPAAFNAEAGYGSYDTSRLSAGFSGEHQGWRYGLQVAASETAGFSNRKGYNPDRDGFREQSFSGNLAYRIDADNEVGLNAFGSDGRNDYDGGRKTSDPKYSPQNHSLDNSLASLGLYSRNRILPNWQSTLRHGWTIDDATNRTDGIAQTHYRTAQTQTAWQNDLTLPLGRALLAAERLEQRLSTSEKAYDGRERHIDSLLAGWGGSVGAHRWQVNGRHDDISDLSSKNTGSAAYGYQFTDAWRLAASLGTAFKAPTMNDLYSYVKGMGKGDPNLKPEYARNRELSLHYETTAHKASLTWFRNDIDDLIEWGYFGSGTEKTPRNVKAEIDGFTLAWRGLFGRLSLRGSLDLQDPRNTQTGDLLTRRARQHGVVGADYVHGSWTFGGEIVGSGGRFDSVYEKTAPGRQRSVRMDAYTLLNLTASYRIDRETSLFVRLNNVFDEDYELASGYATPGTNAMVGIRYAQK